MKRVGLLLLVVVSLLGCNTKKDEVIPNVSFSGTLNMMNPEHTVSPFVERIDETGRGVGYAGVVVYRLTSDTYFVYDRMCPNEKSVQSLVVLIPKEDAIVMCPTCKSRFMVNDGYGTVLPGSVSRYALKAYQNKYDPSTESLDIWN